MKILRWQLVEKNAIWGGIVNAPPSLSYVAGPKYSSLPISPVSRYKKGVYRHNAKLNIPPFMIKIVGKWWGGIIENKIKRMNIYLVKTTKITRGANSYLLVTFGYVYFYLI